ISQTCSTIMVRLRGRPLLRIMYSRMPNSLGARSMVSAPRTTLRRMQSGGGLAAAQEGADAGQEFDEGEGLDEVIVGALFQAFDAIVEGAAGAQDEHRGADFAVADFFEDLEAVHVGQHTVQNHQVVIGGMDALECGGAGERGIDCVTGSLEAPAEEVSDALFVLDD